MTELIMPVYEPLMEIACDLSTNLDHKVGQKVKLIADYTVMEKTKNYTIMRIKNVYAIKSKRKF